jgi:hypothetical protein
MTPSEAQDVETGIVSAARPETGINAASNISL